MSKRKPDRLVADWLTAVERLAQARWTAGADRAPREDGELFGVESDGADWLRVVRWYPAGPAEEAGGRGLLSIYAGPTALTDEAHTRPSAFYEPGVIQEVLSRCNMTLLNLERGDRLSGEVRGWLKKAGVRVVSRERYPLALRMRSGRMALTTESRELRRLLGLVRQVTAALEAPHSGAPGALVDALAGAAGSEPGDEHVTLPVVVPGGAVRLREMPGPEVVTPPEGPGSQVAELPVGDASWLVGVTDLSSMGRAGAAKMGMLTVVAMPYGRAYHHVLFDFSARAVMDALLGLMRGDSVEGNLQEGSHRAPNPGRPQVVGFAESQWAEQAQSHFANSPVPWVDMSNQEQVCRRVRDGVAEGMMQMREGLAVMEAGGGVSGRRRV